MNCILLSAFIGYYSDFKED